MTHLREKLIALPQGTEVQLCPTNTSYSKPRKAVVVRHTATLIIVKPEDRISEEVFRLSDGLYLTWPPGATWAAWANVPNVFWPGRPGHAGRPTVPHCVKNGTAKRRDRSMGLGMSLGGHAMQRA